MNLCTLFRTLSSIIDSFLSTVNLSPLLKHYRVFLPLFQSQNILVPFPWILYRILLTFSFTMISVPFPRTISRVFHTTWISVLFSELYVLLLTVFHPRWNLVPLLNTLEYCCSFFYSILNISSFLRTVWSTVISFIIHCEYYSPFLELHQILLLLFSSTANLSPFLGHYRALLLLLQFTVKTSTFSSNSIECCHLFIHCED